MTVEPIRLLEGLETSPSERALLEAGRQAPVAYDTEAGALRFRATLAAGAVAAGIASEAAQGAGASGGLGARSLLAKVASKLSMVLAVGAPLVGAGLFVRAEFAQEPRAASGVSAIATATARPAPTATAPLGASATTNVVAPSATTLDTTAWSVPTPTAAAPAPAPTVTTVPSRSVTMGDGHPADRRHDGSGGARHGAARVRTNDAAARASSATPSDPDGIMAASGAPRPAEITAASAPATAAAPSPAAAAAPQSPTPGASPSGAAAAALGADPVAVPPFAAGPVAAVPAPPPAGASHPAASDSLAELRGIAQARALVDRDPDAALDILDQVRRDHPNGYFVEERQALTVLALARAGRGAQARQAGAAFLRAYPNGPFSDRVRAATAR